jgi:hypothetical protein
MERAGLKFAQHKRSLWDRIRELLLEKLGGVDGDVHQQALVDYSAAAEAQGYQRGIRECKIEWRMLPAPFTADQLQGKEYGSFITPVGFAAAFGECNVPAPGPFGYEQRAYYVIRNELNLPQSANDLRCHFPKKFDNPADSDQLVPVIVTVLR